jgi:hypothetical protein
MRSRASLETIALECLSRWTLARARIKVDCATILVARREHRRPRRSVWRYLTFDASPKKGQELFVAKQYVVYDGDTSGASWEYLPRSSIGHGFASVADKSYSLTHACFLVAGPGAFEMERWFRLVRWCSADSGAELPVVNSQNSIGPILACLRTGEAPPELVPPSFLMELARRGRGWNRL